jgi:hypothetical protein
MPRFFFDLTDNGVSFADSEGSDLATREAAEDEAAIAIMSIAKDAMPDGNFRQLSLRAREDGGAQIFEVLVTFELRRDGRSGHELVAAG